METMNFKYSRKAQIGVYDAILFFVIMNVASAGIILYSYSQDDAKMIKTMKFDLTNTILTSILFSTVPYVEYTDTGGITQSFINVSVLEILLHDLNIRTGSPNMDSLAIMEEKIREICDNALETDKWLLTAKFGSIEVNIPPEGGKYGLRVTYITQMFNDAGEVIIGLSL